MVAILACGNTTLLDGKHGDGVRIEQAPLHKILADAPMQLLLLSHDGLTVLGGEIPAPACELDEAFPEGGDDDEQFGQAGIIRCLKESLHLTLEETLEKLFEDSHAATRGAGRADDTTVVLLERSE